MANTAIGLDTMVINKNIKIAGMATPGSFDGLDNSPKRKKITICIRLVVPSKKCTRFFLSLILLFPIMIPVIYALR